MSCNKANNCQKYKMNIGNPNDWENPCNRCPYNISDYDSGYNKAIDDFAILMKETLNHDWATAKISEQIIYNRLFDKCSKIAEQLKVGGENE